MGKNYWRETIGVKVWSEIPSPGQNFLFWRIWCDVPGWLSAFCRVPSLHFSCRVPPRPLRFASELYASGAWSISSGFFTRFGGPTSENYDSVFLTGVRPESGISLWGATRLVKFPNFSLGESISRRNFTPEPEIFTSFQPWQCTRILSFIMNDCPFTPRVPLKISKK